MNKDLESFLSDWPFDPASVNARWIMGEDGRPKIQLRLDLGVLQLEASGRPDGGKPHGYMSLLDYYNAREHREQHGGEPFRIDAAACAELQQEAAQYYYRYIALYALRDLAAVAADTQHNLKIIELVTRRAAQPDLARQFTQFLPYVRMMNGRARAEYAVERGEFDEAIGLVDEAIGAIRDFLAASGVADETPCREIDMLAEMGRDIRGRRPKSREDVLREELEQAIASEDYEKAARLRDALNNPPAA